MNAIKRTLKKNADNKHKGTDTPEIINLLVAGLEFTAEYTTDGWAPCSPARKKDLECGCCKNQTDNLFGIESIRVTEVRYNGKIETHETITQSNYLPKLIYLKIIRKLYRKLKVKKPLCSNCAEKVFKIIDTRTFGVFQRAIGNPGLVNNIRSKW